MRKQFEPPPSPFLTSINNRDDFNTLINGADSDDDEAENQANEVLKQSLPAELHLHTNNQRHLAEHCLEKSGGFGRFQWIACILLVLGVDCSALIN